MHQALDIGFSIFLIIIGLLFLSERTYRLIAEKLEEVLNQKTKGYEKPFYRIWAGILSIVVGTAKLLDYVITF